MNVGSSQLLPSWHVTVTGRASWFPGWEEAVRGQAGHILRALPPSLRQVGGWRKVERNKEGRGHPTDRCSHSPEKLEEVQDGANGRWGRPFQVEVGAAGPEAGGLAGMRPGRGRGEGGGLRGHGQALPFTPGGRGQGQLSQEDCYWLTFRGQPACDAENRLGKWEAR